MKKALLLKPMLLLCALIVGMNSAWATDYNFTFSSTTGSYNSTDKTITWSDSYCSIKQTKGSSTTDVSSSYVSEPRWYKSHVIYFTPAAGYKITKIVLVGTKPGNTAYYGQTMTASAGTVTNTSTTTTTWEGTALNSSAVSLTMGSQFRPGTVTITYEAVPVKTNTTLTLEPNSLNLSYGGNAGTLTATVTPEGGAALTNPTITWESNNENVATVAGGTVTPVGEGSCTITATYAGNNTYNGSSNTATVTVTDNRIPVVSNIESIWFQKTLYVGRTAAFTPDVTLASGLSADDVTYSYVSADPSTIRINNDGTFTVLKTGTNIDVTVTATPVAANQSTHKPVSATFQHSASYRYSKPVFTPTGVTDGKFSGSMTLEMANDGTPTGPIYYTTDGTEPAVDKSNCTLYTEALTLTATTTVKARVIDDDGQYSTVTSATYTKVAAQKDAITLAVNQTLSFTNFSELGSSYLSNGSKYVTASDGDKYEWTGTDIGCFDSSTMQIKNNASAYATASPITAPNGFRMTLTLTAGSGSVKVYVGDDEQTAVSSSSTSCTFEIKSNSATAVTIKRKSGTANISNITFTGLKPSRTVTFPDGDQTITVGGETITKTATVTPAGTATYSTSDATIATVNETTGEVTAVKGGQVIITATVAADENYEKSTGTYKVTVNKGATTLAFEHAEETVELVNGTATFTATATPADNTRVITYSSDDITVNASTGAVTLTETGDFVIKANATATDKYLAAETNYTLHVVDSRVPVVNAEGLALVLTDALDENIALDGVKKGDEGFLSATYTKAAGFEGTEVVSFATSDATVLKISNGNEFEALKGGTAKVTVTVTSGGNNMFTTVEKEFTITVTNENKTATEITIEPATTPINTTYGADPIELLYEVTAGYDGEFTYELSNPSIATVSIQGGTATITPVAAGTTKLTFSAPETANFTAAEDVELTINVAEATGNTTTPAGDDYWIYQNTLLSNSLPSDWTGDGSSVWYSQKNYGAVTTTGKTGGTYDLSTEVDCAGYTNIGVTFDHTGNNLTNISAACNVYVKVGNNEEEKLTITNFDSDGSWTYVNSGEINLGSDYDNAKVKFIFRYTPTDGNNGKWEIKNFKVYGTEIPYEEITIKSSGYGSYCYQYPLDLDLLDENIKAYIVTDAKDGKVTFKRITGTIKGGVPFILYGEPGDYTLYTAPSSTNVPEGNMLKGTLSPKYITTVEGEYTNFGLKNGTFVKINSGNLPANKAYLPILTSVVEGTGADAPSFNIVFDDETTDIDQVNKGQRTTINGQYYDLNGRPVNTPSKGIYILNGRKVVVK